MTSDQYHALPHTHSGRWDSRSREHGIMLDVTVAGRHGTGPLTQWSYTDSTPVEDRRAQRIILYIYIHIYTKHLLYT